MNLLTFDTYIGLIKNSVGSTIFKNLYMSIDGTKTDITENGNLSCAYYVSSLLYILKLLKSPHATVDSTVSDMLSSGWEELTKPKVGSVIVWEKIDFGGGKMHKHIGFYMGENRAISNNSSTGEIYEHDWMFDGSRKIERMFWHPDLEK